MLKHVEFRLQELAGEGAADVLDLLLDACAIPLRRLQQQGAQHLKSAQVCLLLASLAASPSATAVPLQRILAAVDLK